MLHLNRMREGESVVVPHGRPGIPAMWHAVIHERLRLELRTDWLDVWVTDVRGGIRIAVRLQWSRELLRNLRAYHGDSATGFGVVIVV